MKLMHPLLLALIALLASAPWQDADACACCTSPGERADLVVKLESGHAEELSRLRFGPKAELFLGEAEPETVKGITTPAAKYDLQIMWKGDRFVFVFRDEKDRSGTLMLRRPKTISVLHTGPRNQPDKPNGPALYKEWRLTSPAVGTGVFTAGLGAGQSLTLVLQGGGNNCTSANDFTHWMLVMWGPKAKYHFFGDLMRTP
jgi:hypothetical protein